MGLPPANETRAPIDGGCSSSSVISTPASFKDRLYFIIANMRSGSSSTSGGAVSYPNGIISIMNRMADIPDWWSGLFPGAFGAQAGLLLAQFGRERIAEIF